MERLIFQCLFEPIALNIWSFQPNSALLFLLQPAVLGKVRWLYNSFKISKCLSIEEPVRAQFNLLFCLEVVLWRIMQGLSVVTFKRDSFTPRDEF